MLVREIGRIHTLPPFKTSRLLVTCLNDRMEEGRDSKLEASILRVSQYTS
jgi:hypothetical protein